MLTQLNVLATGLGLAISEVLSEKGYHVIMSSRGEKEVRKHRASAALWSSLLPSHPIHLSPVRDEGPSTHSWRRDTRRLF